MVCLLGELGLPNKSGSFKIDVNSVILDQRGYQVLSTHKVGYIFSSSCT